MDIRTEFKGKGKNILVLTYWSFSDALIQTYTLPYVKMIRGIVPVNSKIFLFTLEKAMAVKSPPGVEAVDGIQHFSARYYPFGWKACVFWTIEGIKLFRLIRRERISFIHCWGTPAGAIGYILSKLTGSKLIIDSYEPHAEAMVENGSWSRRGIAFRFLFWLERKQSEGAAFLVGATKGMQQYAEEKYGNRPLRFLTKPAGVDLDLFHFRQKKLPDLMTALGLEAHHVVCVYAGKFGGIYLEQETFDIFAAGEAHWGERFKVLLLTNTPSSKIYDYARKSGLDEKKIIIRFVPHHEVPMYIGVADFGITPVKPVPSKRYCTPIKNGEYWALGLPVIIPANISDDSEIIEKNDIGAVLYELNQSAYSKAMQKIDNLIQRDDLSSAIRNVAREYRSFDAGETIYKVIYS